MTAEVAILNRAGVALAADSAVTIGRDADKIYTSAEKLFQMSHRLPIGVMVYGNADFCGLPWETIIKTYRSTHGGDNFDTVEECGARFVDFLGGAHNLFPRTRQDEHAEGLLASLLEWVRERLSERFDKEAEQQDGLDDSDIPPILESELSEVLDLVRRQEFLPGFNEEARASAAQYFRDRILNLITSVFGELPFTDASKESLVAVCDEMLVRHCFGPLECGLVIAGFGSGEFTPSLVSFELEEMILDTPRYVRAQTHVVGDTTTAAVIPFAQKDMVESFMEGIHHELQTHMTRSTEGLFNGAIEQVLNRVREHDSSLADQLVAAAMPGIAEMLKTLFDEWGDRRKRYWEPVVEVVASLPKDELAAMAEALVNLTKFRRRISAVRETVGGPIDVAVITKGDGFVWTRRKHYFDPTLNPRVIARLRGEVT